MKQVVIYPPDGTPEMTVTIGAESAVLVGRSPDGLAVSGLAPPGEALCPIVVKAPSVSANHALLWCNGDAVLVRDLGSRNGTSVLLPRHATATIEGSGMVGLQLSPAAATNATSDLPPDATYADARDFAAGVLHALEAWLARRGVGRDAVRLHIVPRPERALATHDEPLRMPLADGSDLMFMLVRTVDERELSLLQQLWQYVHRQNQRLETEEETRREGLVLASAAIRRTHAAVADAARRGLRSLLLLGESGSGKEGLAQTYHRYSGRSGPFVALNCAALQKELARVELFGADVGAYTGLTHNVVGAVEQADGGTLFLDELGDMPLDVQLMLLRFLDNGVYDRLGRSSKKRHADVHMVCATNRDLRAAVRGGQFRADLWYRLSIQVVEIPPLRERFEDVEAYLKTRRLDNGLPIHSALTPAALELLRAHEWHGNFRELANFAHRLPVSAAPASIDERACRQALELGAVQPLSEAPRPVPATAAVGETTDWSRLTLQAMQAFQEDFQRTPVTWDDQKEYNERYFKPVVFYHLSGAAQHHAPRDMDEVVKLAHRLAAKVQADRGTAVRQLTRYFERFGQLETNSEP